MAVVELKGVHKIYEGKTHIVKGVDLLIEDGAFLVLVGPSGCGKSTLLRMIAGLEEISRGEIFIDGALVNKLRPKDRDVAMVFQSYALYPHMTVEENMGFGLKIGGIPKDEIKSRVAEAAKTLQIEALLPRYPKQMSGGQRQRVAMGRAIVRKPKVFLFDEPLSNLDASLRAQMRVELKAMHQRMGVTMIYVTHDQVEAMTLASKIVVLNEGIVQQVGAPLELYEKPANKFVAGFIGSPQMNFLSAKLSSGSLLCEGVKSERSFNFGDGDIYLGVRPSDVTAEPIEGASLKFDAKIGVIEPLGDIAIVNAAIGGQPFQAQMPAKRAVGVESGRELTFYARMESLHIFDEKSGKRLEAKG